MEKVDNKKIGLCQGRHEIPGVEEYIFPQEVNPVDVAGLEKTAVMYFFFLRKEGVREVDLYVTGLTVALIAAVNASISQGIKLVLWHFDRQTGGYYPQELKSWDY